MDMIYYGGEDGRFVGYFSDTSYTERGRGYGMATDLPWAPYDLNSSAATLGNINTVCTGAPACRGESGKNLSTSPTCTGTSTAPGSSSLARVRVSTADGQSPFSSCKHPRR